MEVLEAFGLTGGLRAAAALAECDHKTVAHYVALRDAGLGPDDRPRRAMSIDPFPDTVEVRADRSNEGYWSTNLVELLASIETRQIRRRSRHQEGRQ